MIVFDVKQNTDEWLELRKGKITGSKLNDIIVKRGTGKKIGFYQLLADRLSVDENTDEDERERGHRLEDEAIALFSDLTGKKVEQVGMCASDDNEDIMLSPDGLIKKGKKYTEAVEIKCLSTARHLMAYFEQKIPNEYEPQAMQYFIVNENLEKLYFTFYDPRVQSKPIFWIELDRADYEEKIAEYKAYQEETLAEIETLLEQIAF